MHGLLMVVSGWGGGTVARCIAAAERGRAERSLRCRDRRPGRDERDARISSSHQADLIRQASGPLARDHAVVVTLFRAFAAPIGRFASGPLPRGRSSESFRRVVTK